MSLLAVKHTLSLAVVGDKPEAVGVAVSPVNALGVHW